MFQLGYRKCSCYPVLTLAQCLSSCAPCFQIAPLVPFRRVVHHREDPLVVALDQQRLPGLPCGE